MEQIISQSAIFNMGMIAVICGLLPIVLVFFLIILKKIKVKPVVVGILAFLAAQIVRNGFLGLLSSFSWFSAAAQTITGAVFIYCLTAGIFEESARLIGAKGFLRNNVEYEHAIAYGLGHGFCEVVMIVGLSNLSNIMTAMMINDGSMQAALAAAPDVPEGYLEGIIAAMNGATLTTAICAIVERFSAVFFHLFASVLVFKGVREGKIYYWLLAILAHTAFNAISVIINKYFGMITCEIVLFILGAGCLAFVIMQKPKSEKREMI